VKSLLRRRDGCGGVAGDGEGDGEAAALAGAAFDVQPRLMSIGDVLDYGEAEAGAALLTAAFHVDAIKAFGEPRDRVGGNAFAVVTDAGGDRRFRAARTRGMDERERHPDVAVLLSILDRVVHEVLE